MVRHGHRADAVLALFSSWEAAVVGEALYDLAIASAVFALFDLAKQVAGLLARGVFGQLRALLIARKRGATVAAEAAADQRARTVAQTARKRIGLSRILFR